MRVLGLDGSPSPRDEDFRIYLAKLALRLGCSYHGTAIRGGIEGIQVPPAWMTKMSLKGFYLLGKTYSPDCSVKSPAAEKDTVRTVASRKAVGWNRQRSLIRGGIHA